MNPALKALLEDDVGKIAMRELGIESDTPEAQAAVMNLIGETLFNRVLLEILKKLPHSTHDEFDKLMDGEPQPLDEFLHANIPDFDSFVEQEAHKELNAIRREADQIVTKNA